MNTHKLAFIAMVLFLAMASVTQLSGPPAELQRSGQSTKQTTQASLSVADLPLFFELNNGQVDPKVRLLSRGTLSTVFLTPSEVAIELSRPSSSGGKSDTTSAAPVLTGPPRELTPGIFRLKFKGGNPSPHIVPEGKLPGKSHYFVGNDATKWRTNIPQFARGCYRRVYPGVDVVFYGNQRRLEFDFVIAAGGDPASIKLAFEGAQRLEIDGQGDLRLRLRDDEVVFHKPYCYQGTKEEGEEIDGRFTLVEQNCVGFKVGAYNPSLPLTIDPTLSYSTFIGGGKGASCNSCAEDDDGCIYFAGNTGSTEMYTVHPYQDSLAGEDDAYIGKLNAAGTAIVYATYLGGSGREETQDIAVDAFGNAYILGSTASTDFPLKNPVQSKFGGVSICTGDAFVTKLNADGSALLYSTYLGGSQDEQGQGIAVDVGGNAYVMGCTGSDDFPTKSPFQATLTGYSDAFLAKLNASGSRLIYSTYLGGSSDDVPSGYGMGDVAVDDTGCAYVAGFTLSTDFPVKKAFQSKFGGGERDVFVTKFDPSGAGLVFSTFLGGSDNEGFPFIAVAPNGNIGVTGGTRSTDFPTRNPIKAALSGVRDIFVTVFSPNGSDLVFSTYLGGSGSGEVEAVNGIAMGPSNNVCVVGRTDSTDFPLAAAIQSSFQGGDTDAFVSVFSADGSKLTFSSYLGGSSNEDAYGVGLDDAGNIFLGGPTASPEFPTVNPLYESGDIYIARIRMKVTGPVPHLDTISPLNATAGGAEFTLDLNGSDFVDGCTVGWDGSSRPTTFISKTKLTASIAAANLAVGKAVKVTVTNPGGGVSNAKTFNIADYALTASAQSVTVTAGQSATYQLTVAPQFGAFDQAVSLSCSGLPAKCSSSFSPASCTPGSGGVTSTLTITTTAPSASGQLAVAGSAGFPLDPLWPTLATILLLGASVLRSPRRKRAAAWLCIFMGICLFGFLVSCESKGGGDSSPTNPGTPKGTSTITVSGQAGSLTRSIDLTLVVN